MKETKEKSFWIKLKEMFVDNFIFSKRNKIALPKGKIESKNETIKTEDNHFVSNLKDSIDEKNKYIIQLQHDFEDGKIEEDSISSEDIEKLKELYNNQIIELKNSIETCKNKIIKIKNNRK